MDFENAFQLFSEAFKTLLFQNYYFSLSISIAFVGMVFLYFVAKLTNRD